MKNTIIIEQNPQQILNIIQSLSLFRDIAVKPKFKYIVDEQLKDLIYQLENQKINIFSNELEYKYQIGKEVKYENKKAYIVGTSDENEFIKICISENNEVNVIDVPIVLLEL